MCSLQNVHERQENSRENKNHMQSTANFLEILYRDERREALVGFGETQSTSTLIRTMMTQFGFNGQAISVVTNGLHTLSGPVVIYH